MSIPLAEPLYVTSLEELFWGGVLVVITMILHGSGMVAVVRANHAVTDWLKSKTNLMAGMFPVVLASLMIMLVHLTEVGVWTAFFVWQGAFPNRSIAYYFSLNEYTTVGSSVSLPLNWRLLEGIIATAGLLTFAWSTGVLVTLAQTFQDQRIHWLRQRHGQGST
jgi:hypothetical protein